MYIYIYICTSIWYIYALTQQYILLGLFLFVDDQGCKDENLYVVSTSEARDKAKK